MGRLLTMAMSLKYSGSELHNIVLIRMRGDLRMLHTASCCARVIGSSWYSDSGYCQPHHPGAHSLGCRVRAGVTRYAHTNHTYGVEQSRGFHETLQCPEKPPHLLSHLLFVFKTPA